MWLEQFNIIVLACLRTTCLILASYVPTFWDWSTFLGTIGLFFALLFLFIRFLPVISIFEMRELVSEVSEQEASVGD
jgi:molybdopterin-containing oxidoreductase family membrane subunit